MSVFADSSALVKRYADESASAGVRSLDAMVVSQLARVEVPAAIWRKQRIGELDAGDARTLTTAFDADWSGPASPYAAIAIGDHVLHQAAQLTASAGLRAYDAVQLASAILARDADPTITQFACFDHDLAGAAAQHGFAGLGG